MSGQRECKFAGCYRPCSGQWCPEHAPKVGRGGRAPAQTAEEVLEELRPILHPDPPPPAPVAQLDLFGAGS